MHDQRHRPTSKTIKVSSPTLRKLCLPCISARHRQEQPALSIKRQPSKTNQHRLNPIENIIDESSLVRSDGVSRTLDPISSENVLRTSEKTNRNDANHGIEQRQTTCIPIVIDSEADHERFEVKTAHKSNSSERLEFEDSHESSPLLNEEPRRSNEDDEAVGFNQKKKTLFFSSFLLFSFEVNEHEIYVFLFLSFVRVMIKRRC